MKLGVQRRETSVLDDALSQHLSSEFGNLSRRSFLSSVTRKLIGLTGIAVVGEILPSVGLANVDCGRHGYLCGTGNCDLTVNGAEVHNAWVQCCPMEQCPASWRRCTYTDYCRVATEPNFVASGCEGPSSGSSWCRLGPYEFVCTDVSCDPGSYATREGCRSFIGIRPCAVCRGCPP